jgi:hypothetical protein
MDQIQLFLTIFLVYYSNEHIAIGAQACSNKTQSRKGSEVKRSKLDDIHKRFANTIYKLLLAQ